MNRNVLLISESSVKTYSNLNDNLFSKWLLPAIRESQEMGLMPIIGECLYNRICDLVGNDLIGDDMYVQYKDLLDDYIEPYLIYQTLTNVTPLINGKMGNIGTVSTNDEHIINLSQGELDLVQNYYRERADFYQIRLQNWVKANASAFPELECSCENMQPNLDRANNSVGLWLGGVRGKRMAQKCSCNGEQKSQGGDYAQGYADGYASGRTAQKALITSLTVSENGTYENENGYNPVVVDVAGGTLQEKDVNLPYDVSGITITPDSDFYGLSSVTVDATWALDYKYNEGFQEGVLDTKGKMEDIVIDHNGTFSSPSGYDIVTVNVPQTGGSVTLTGGSLTVSSNTQTATPPAGTAWSAMTVDATIFGNTREQDGVTIGYNMAESGMRSQMGTTAFTENGTYYAAPYPKSWTAVTVNVPQTGGSCNLQEKWVEVPVGEDIITVLPDEGYDGMSAVTIGARIASGYWYDKGAIDTIEEVYPNSFLYKLGSCGMAQLNPSPLVYNSGYGYTIHITGHTLVNCWGVVTFDDDPAIYDSTILDSGYESDITDVVFPESSTELRHPSFTNYTSLSRAVIGSLTHIATDAFGGCALTNISLDSIESLGNYAFFNNPLETIMIGRNITSIGAGVFAVGDYLADYPPYSYNTDSLKAIYCEASYPPSLPIAMDPHEEVFYGRTGSGVLHTPIGTKSDYEADWLPYLPSGWVVEDDL